MTSREIVRRTLGFDYPERVARSFNDSDFLSVTHAARTYATGWREIKPGLWERLDEWGNLWHRVESHSKGEVSRGVLANLGDIEKYAFPDFSHEEDYAPVRKRRSEHSDKWLIGKLPGFAFSIARKMRKLDQYLMDLILEADKMHSLHDRIDDILEQMIRNYAEAGADCVMLEEDWGTQSQTLIGPELWRKEFYPRFERLCRTAHEAGVHVFMHSCGQIEAIVPWLIEAGVDVLQFDQPRLHGIDVLASHQKDGRVTFWCPVDIQTTLQRKDEKAIRAEAREMLEKLWKGRGGFIAGYYEDNESIGLEQEWQEYACDEFLKLGVR